MLACHYMVLLFSKSSLHNEGFSSKYVSERLAQKMIHQSPSGGERVVPALRKGWSALLSCRAFTLVEVCLAIGVTTVSLLGIFALMQSGLLNYRRAVNSTIASSIRQQVLSQYLLADYAQMVSLPPQTNFYDERGLLVSTNSGIYQSVAEILTSTVPGIGTNNLVGIKVTITSAYQRDFRKTSTMLVARQSKN